MIPGSRGKKAIMSEPAFQSVEKLFHKAVEVDPGRRAAFLDAACGGDSALRAAVQDLLNHDAEADASTFLASPVVRPPDAATVPGWSKGGGPAPTLPGYEVLEELGRGGMGVVYKARHIHLNRLVALKMLLPGTPADLEPLARFRAEAELLARLNHPNIVPIYDIGECEGRPYFTMEYVAGPNLARFLDGRPQDAAASARLIETLARAVHAAHQCGVIHRDLKPANILLSSEGRGARGGKEGDEGTDPSSLGPHPSLLATPKITDFGLAKDQTASRGLTRIGAAMGTPCYMAPEQARGDSKAHRPCDGYLRPWNDPVRDADGPPSLRRADRGGNRRPGVARRPRSPVAPPAAPAARPGSDLHDVSGKVGPPALRHGAGPSGRPAALPGRRTDPRPPGRPGRTCLSLVPSAASGRLPACPPQRPGGRLRRHRVRLRDSVAAKADPRRGDERRTAGPDRSPGYHDRHRPAGRRRRLHRVALLHGRPTSG